MHIARMLKGKTPDDKALNRLIIGSVLVLLIGVPLLTVVYLSDRWVDPGPTMVERRIQELETAVRQTPNSVATRLQLVGAYTAAGRDSDALTQLNEVLKVQSDSKTALLARGDIYHRQGNLDAATKDYQAIVDLMKGEEFAPEDTELESAFYNLGSIALERNKAADAIDPLTSALKIDASNADTLNLLGRAYLATGQTDKAIGFLRQAVAFVPTDWCDPYLTLAQAYTAAKNAPEASWSGAMATFCQKQPDLAKQQLQPLVNGPAATDALLGLGMIAETQSDPAAASDAYRKVLARDPGNFNAQTGLSRVTAPASATPGAAATPGPSHPDIPSAPPSSGPAAGGNT